MGASASTYFKEIEMAKKKKTYGEMSREERVTGKPPAEESEGALDKDSREYKAAHYKKKTNG